MRRQVWETLTIDSPLTVSQIIQRLSQTDATLPPKKQIPYPSMAKYLIDLTTLGLIETVEPNSNGNAALSYRVTEGSTKMYGMLQQTHRQLVEVLQSRTDPSVVRFVRDISREGMLTIARGFAERYPDAYREMIEELRLEGSNSTGEE